MRSENDGAVMQLTVCLYGCRVYVRSIFGGPILRCKYMSVEAEQRSGHFYSTAPLGIPTVKTLLQLRLRLRRYLRQEKVGFKFSNVSSSSEVTFLDFLVINKFRS